MDLVDNKWLRADVESSAAFINSTVQLILMTYFMTFMKLLHFYSYIPLVKIQILDKELSRIRMENI